VELEIEIEIEREREKETLGRFVDNKMSVTVDRGGECLYLILLCYFLRGVIMVYFNI